MEGKVLGVLPSFPMILGDCEKLPTELFIQRDIGKNGSKPFLRPVTQICNESFSVLPANSQIMTQSLLISYKSSALT